MKIYVGITDYDWFITLKTSRCDEINFWKPGGNTNFKALEEGDLFLFKLHSPQDYIVGGGFFIRSYILHSSLAWDAFGIANGARNLFELNSRVYKYRKSNRLTDPDPQIGCIILSMPFYFEKEDWIPVPEDWSPSIVQGKTYRTDEIIGRRLYQQVRDRITKIDILDSNIPIIKEGLRYGSEQMIKPRLGQGTFRITVTEAYHRRCALTGEKTLPVLEAAHIKPYSQDGTHDTYNGLLLRQDLHTLFDRGYITVTEDYHIEVSKRIKEDYGNGKEYYALHGKELIILPDNVKERPSIQLLRWHNENVYLA